VRAEANVPFIYDDLRKGPLRPLSTYEEANGTPTMGIGVAIQGAAARQQYAKYLGKQIPPDELEQINRLKLSQFEGYLNKHLVGARLSQAMYDALFSLMWNTGPNSSAILKATDAIRRGDYQAAQHEIANGPITSKGRVLDTLVRRRAEEAARFAEEGLDRFRDAAAALPELAKQAALDFNKSPIPYIIGVVLIAGTTFFFTRKVLQ
jgi:GH24 family phage-related lysozyme (muramidase)